ncbi:divalent metal cation transporter [Alteromonas portus]|uniref:Divalent metal cation transporter n=1 Tax=Alteromonas portus TaxID=2565549 RepID=A0A4U0ZBL1_9ALTE|nr:Nramp family divalent metal transporter [Alteromonas portus]TKB01937.1 divalent metal cation transporter [Alteromonas portus]
MTALSKIIKNLLPGIFLFGFTVGTGSVTAMAKAGADYGMSLLWAILISCVITYFLIQLFGKFTLQTGLTALQAFKQHIHPAVSLFFIVALTTQVCGSVMGVMGIIADVCFEWSKQFIEGGIAPIYFALFFSTFVYLVFLVGKTDVFQQVLAVLVAIMALCFLVNFIMLMPPLSDIALGLVPNIPDTGPDKSSFLVVASMVGTTVFSGLFILRSILVLEAKWTVEDMKTQKKDALFSAFLMFVVSMSIMAAGTGALYAQGIQLTHVTQMVTLLEPLAGQVAVTIFTLGLIAAGISSQFPNVALLPWLLDDYNKRKTDLKRTHYRIIALIISLLGLVVPIFEAKPISVMIASQAFGALILPATVASIFYVGNKRKVMKTHVFGFITNATLVLIFAFALVMSYMSINGIIATVQSV